MNGHNSETLCRICLESGASLPIFNGKNNGENNVHTKLSNCLRAKIEDLEGYPRNICKKCNKTLDTVLNFINKYEETCKFLENRLFRVKNECYSDLSDNEACEIEIKSEKLTPCDESAVKAECMVEMVKPLIRKIAKNNTKKEPIKKIRLKNRKVRSVNTTNSIASSILEGDFTWSGEKWCFNNNEKSILKKPELPLQVKKNREIQLDTIKVKVTQDPSKLCDVCGIVFNSSDKLSIHKKRTHFKNPVHCPKCLREYVSDYYLNRHIKRTHEDNKDYICSKCGKGFAYKNELTNHNRNVHNKHLMPKKMFSCKFCDKIYKCPKSVTVHERSVHTGQRPAVCSECGKSFYHEDYLRDHMRLHTGETPFKCPVCGRGYAQRCNMKSHLRIHRVSEIDPLTLSKMRPNYLKLLKS